MHTSEKNGQFFNTATAVLLIPFQFFFFAACASPVKQESVRKDTLRYDTLTLSVVGDLMCHTSQFNSARKNTTYDFRPVYAAVRPYLLDADWTFGNLETVTAGEEEKFTGYPQFNTPVEYLDALKDAGFDVLTTANNHSLDRRFKGVEKTIQELEARGLLHTGSFRSREEREKVLIVEKKNIRLAVLAYSFSTNGIPFPEGKQYCVNLIDTLLMKADIANAKAKGCDQISVFIHWGEEYQRKPNDRQLAIAGFLRRQGVGMVFGSHPHVLQPMDRSLHRDSTFFAVYSMGNFISGQRKPYTESGVVVRVRLVKESVSGRTRIDKVDYIPTYVSLQQGYKVLPVQDAIRAAERGVKEDPAYSPLDLPRLREVWKETTELLTNPPKSIFPHSTIDK